MAQRSRRWYCPQSARRTEGEDFPVVPIEVVEAPPLHEAVVLQRHGISRSGGLGLAHQFGDLRARLPHSSANRPSV